MAEENMRKGFVTIATGYNRYYIMARNLLLSYRHFAKDPLPFAIICDRTNKYTEEFDDVILLPDPAYSYIDKLSLPSLAPYDQTIFIDADCLVYRDLSDMWKVFEGAPTFCVLGRELPLDSETGWFKKSDVGEFSDKIKFCLTFQGGAYYIDRNGAGLSDFINTVNYIHEHYFEYRFRLFQNPTDETVFSLACAVHGYAPADNYFPWICYLPLVKPKRINIKRGLLAYRHKKDKELEIQDGHILHWGHNKHRWLFLRQSFDILLRTAGLKTAVIDSSRLAWSIIKKMTTRFFKKMTPKVISVVAALVAATGLFAQSSSNYVTKAGRMDRCKLNIGVYHLRPYARTEAHIKDLADCGIDFVICMENDRPALDLFSKYGVGAIVSGIVPGWWGGDGDNAGKLEETNPLSKYEEAAASFQDHPAIWGIDVGDEPSALDFPYFGKVLAKVEDLFPNQFAFLNLYPNYASVSQNTAVQTKNQLGTPTYEEHIRQYCEYVPADYISYDFYYKNVGVAKDYANLRVVSDACRASGRGMWVTVQVNSYDPKVWITENELRFQAYSALAFGAENITWACYTAGWWKNQVVDENGQKTQQYDKLKKVNAELHSIGKDYMKYINRSTSFVGFEKTDMLEETAEKSLKEYSDGVISNLSAGCPLVVGEMAAKDGSDAKALFICVADDPFDKAPKNHLLRFKAPGKEVTVRGGEGYIPMRRDAEGWYEIPVSSCQGILVEATSSR